MSFSRRMLGIALALLVCLGLVACTRANHADQATMAHADSAPQPTPGVLSVVDVMARTVPLADGNGAVYMTILNGTDAEVRLTGASSPLAESVDMHETVDDNGILRMMPLGDGVAIPAGGAIVFAAGGKHVMLNHLAAPLKAGDEVVLTLNFSNGDSIDVKTVASDMIPEEPGAHSGH